MQLDTLRNQWERLGRRDPYWAVLTDPTKAGRRWAPGDLYANGVGEIDAVFERASRLGLDVSTRRALDFGCGVGRITQALAGRFERVDGVDIASSMLEEARRHNRHGHRAVYHLNTAPDLALFADQTFTLVYSVLVLQHMEPTFATGYVREFLRVLAPGGLAIFQVPSRRAAHEAPADAPVTPVAGRLPDAAFRASLSVPDTTMALDADAEATLAVTVENRSAHTWPALGDSRGRHRINLANSWFSGDGEPLQRDDGRCPLPHDLAPGARAVVMLGVRAPKYDGQYILELDMVQENVAWFGERASHRLRVPVTVRGGLPASRRPAPASSAWHRSRRAPFRERHPRLSRIAHATPLRRLYWTWHARVFEPFVTPAINWWHAQPFTPRMEMHCVPRADIMAIIESSAAALVDTEEELIPGGFTSCRYWVLKPPRLV